jgi:hypothetical protein
VVRMPRRPRHANTTGCGVGRGKSGNNWGRRDPHLAQSGHPRS